MLEMLRLSLLAFLLSTILVPLIKRIGLRYKIYAKENYRTVHEGKIVRIGGVAVFLAFNIIALLTGELNFSMLMILFGGLIVFIGGLLDDIYNLKPLLKLIFIMMGALIPVLLGGISLKHISILGLQINFSSLAAMVSFIWIVGVSNAINLIDGLDGLSSGICVIVLTTFFIIGSFSNHLSTAMVAVVLAGAILGFLPYNFHPASIFLGDSGALYLGYMIACLSLIGFKTSTFVSLAFPIIILFIPLQDTVLAIIRRKLKGQSIAHADRYHMHHIIMDKVGFSHRNTVLLLYLITILFAISAIVLFFDIKTGFILIGILCIIAWLFVELTGMISPRFHPIIGLVRKLVGHPKKRFNAHFEANKIKKEE